MHKQSLVFLVKLLITVVVLALVLRTIDVEEARSRLQQADPSLILFAVLLIVIQSVGIISLRWGRVLASIDRSPPIRSLAHMVAVGLFFNQVLPATVGGDGMRIWMLSRLQTPVGLAIRSVIIDRLFGLFAVMLLASFGAAGLLWRLPASGPLLALLLTGMAGLVCILAAPALARLCAALPIAPLRQTFAMMATEVSAIGKDGRTVAYLIALSLLGQVLTSVTIWLIARSLDVELGLAVAAALVPGIIMVTSIPLSIAGWGVREGAMVVGLGLLGVPAQAAALVSVIYGLLLLAVGLGGGVIWLASGALRSSYARRKHSETA